MDNSKLVIFDFDGTIADTMEAGLKVLREFSDEGFIPSFTNDDIQRWKKMSPRDIIKEVKIPWWKITILVLLSRKRLKKHLDNVKLFEGIHDQIKRISKQFPCVVISSNSKSSVDYMLNKFEITEFKETKGGGSLFGKYKKINKILKKYNVQSKDAILITDEARDIDSAHISEVHSIAVTWGYQDKSVLKKHKPTMIASKTNELVSAVNSIFTA